MNLALPARGVCGLQPLETVYEASGQPTFSLPDELATTYGGSLGFAEPRLYANFVARLDGVVANPGQRQSSHLLAAGSAAAGEMASTALARRVSPARRAAANERSSAASQAAT